SDVAILSIEKVWADGSPLSEGATFIGVRPEIDWPQPTNWWWWLTEGSDLGVRISAPGHSMFEHLGQDDLTWHLHGWFAPPEGVE
ncbi:hypothetical protein ACC841_36320, partial [Rhizobium ruizarguesonis]